MTSQTTSLHPIGDARPVSFVDTRSRSTDSISSRLAAKTAAGGKAGELRRRIQGAVIACGPLTARELASLLCVDYYDVQRRISETAGIRKTDRMRDGGMVWEAGSA